jgi:hypothetical protein
MHVKLYGVVEEERWQEGEWENQDNTDVAFGASPNVRWFVEYSVGFYDADRTRGVSKKKLQPIELNTLPILTVISPELKRRPIDKNENREDLRNARPIAIENALVLNHFSQAAVTEYLRDKIENLDVNTVDGLKRNLKEFLTLHP